MKKLYYLASILLIPVALIIQAYSSGSPGGKTGSPGDNGTTCTQCHSGTTMNPSNWITTNIPGDGWLPGETYSISATGTHTGVSLFGFELTAENTLGQKVGTFTITDPGQTKLVTGNTAVTHTSGGTTPSGDSKTWTFDWTAPSSDEGDIVFYAAFNAANGNGGTSGDLIYLSQTIANQNTLGIEDQQWVNMINIYPNPAVNQIYVAIDKELSGAEVQLLNLNGQIVQKQFITTIGEFDISQLRSAYYFMKIISGNQVYIKKVIKN